jgi:hypothetical protein
VKQLIALPLTLCLVVALGAQQPAPSPAPAAKPGTAAPAPRAQQPPTAKPVAPGQAEPAAAPRPIALDPLPNDPLRNEPINMRYEITIREEGGAQPGVKTLTMTGTLYELSTVRSTSDLRSPLNVDVNPTALNGSKVRTKIGIEYTAPGAETAGTTAMPLIVRQTIHVWLDSGKSMVVSQTADPRSDRRLTIEVTATVIR